MSFRFADLPSAKAQVRTLEPIALFRSLTVTDPEIKDLWLAQGDTLRGWDRVREKHDIVVSLNTGADKTLIGLLMAQSLVNETGGSVFYACSSRQLVHQTAAKAAGYGLQTTTYLDQEFSDTLFTQGRVPCITTYHALFNGRSRFGRAEPAAVVFDDAHTAAHILRDQFTLEIDREGGAESYDRLVHLFRPYSGRIPQDMGYLDTVAGRDRSGSRFVPPFAVAEVHAEIQFWLLTTSPPVSIPSSVMCGNHSTSAWCSARRSPRGSPRASVASRGA